MCRIEGKEIKGVGEKGCKRKHKMKHMKEESEMNDVLIYEYEE